MAVIKDNPSLLKLGKEAANMGNLTTYVPKTFNEIHNPEIEWNVNLSEWCDEEDEPILDMMEGVIEEDDYINKRSWFWEENKGWIYLGDDKEQIEKATLRFGKEFVAYEYQEMRTNH